MNKPLKIWQNIYQIGGAELSDPSDCSVYLLDVGDLLLIDTGAGNSFAKLVTNIQILSLDPERLKSILITHAHIDHIGAISQFQQTYRVQVIAHELDSEAIENGRGVGAEIYGIDYIPGKVDIRIQGVEQSLPFGQYEVRIVHIPGHTPGSLAAYIDIQGKRVLFGQDIHGPYFPEIGADPDMAKESLQKLIDLKADILCEGHFGIYQPAKTVEEYIRRYLERL